MLDELGLATEESVVNDYLSSMPATIEEEDAGNEEGLSYYLEMMKPELDEASNEEVVSLIKGILQYVK